MKKIIQEYHETLLDASARQNSLYDEFNKVKLVDFPYITECGIYKWEIEE